LSDVTQPFEDGADRRIPLEEARAAFVVSPFTRLARTHVFSIAGDALFTMGLAGTVFFNTTDLDEARWKVALTLLFTIAPFAAAAPLIGPSLDRLRGGRRWMIVGSSGMRAVLSVLLIQNFDNYGFYPLAFLMLVAGKSYQIAKSALVPTTVRNDAELVEANSKLTLLSGVAVVVAAVPGGIFWKFGGADWLLGIAAVVFLVAAIVALRLPHAVVAAQPVDDVERQELRSSAIVLAASAMGILRALVGFLAFLLAFDYRGEDGWKLGVLVVAAQAGFLSGAALAPRLRKLVEEEYILIGVLLTVVVTSVGSAFSGGLFVASLMSLTLGIGSSAGKQAFDAIVQRDAPDANRGRSFARFETRFQLMWVVGALIPVAISIPPRMGFVMMAAVAAFGGLTYWAGLKSANLRAAALIRRLRRQQRADDELALARDLGFATGIDDTARRTRRGSAAARIADRRRRQHRADAVEESVAAASPPTPPTMPTSPPQLPFDEPAAAPEEPQEQGPDLDWHPQY
jgi:hypothetical protein